MTTKRNILVFIDWFWPGYLAGGPVQSIVSLLDYLSSEYNFKIITTNRDLKSTTPYPGIEPNCWVRSALNCDVFYADPDKLDTKTIETILATTTFDIVYLNSFFSRYFSIVPLQLLNARYPEVPVILAPRGMLGSGALAIKKYKKRLFIYYSRLKGLHKNVLWQATSEQEAEEIKFVISRNSNIRIVSNLPKKMTCQKHIVKKRGELKLFFLSRISEKKNLKFALNILLGNVFDCSLNYSIYGPIEDETYWKDCQKLIKQMPGNVSVNYKGSLSPEQIENALSQEQVLFLPTRNENYGHAIVESLLCACPVLISDQTPWKDLETEGAGYALPLEKDFKFHEAITFYASMNQEEFEEASKRSIEYIRHKMHIETNLNQYRELFNA